MITPAALKGLRAHYGWTQPQAAKATGIGFHTWCDWEQGKIPRAAKTAVVMLALMRAAAEQSGERAAESPRKLRRL